MRWLISTLCSGGVLWALSASAPSAMGQGGGKGPLPGANAGDQVLVKREAARLTDPEKYRAHLYLEPVQSITLAAPFDGVIRQISVKINGQVKSQQELIRLDNTVQKFQLARAQAAFKAATIENKLADKKDENQAALAQAKLDVAKAELDLAQHNVDQATLRAPIIGDVMKIFVTEGEFVRAGDPLVTVGDFTRLKVEIPAERNQVEKDKPFTLKVEQAEVQGIVDAVLPLSEKFDPLRDLFESIASASVIVDNNANRLKPGQTVYVPLVPRNPVVEVAASAVANLPDGSRKVQVLRQWMVRDIPVALMGAIGTNRLYVSGTFAEGDEVIYETSHTLPDGFVLRSAAAPATGSAANTSGAGAGGTTPATGTTKPASGGF